MTRIDTMTAAILSTFDVAEDTEVPREAIIESARVVDSLDWEVASEWGDSIHAEYACKRLAEASVEDPEQWVVVASRYTNLSGWDEYEGKMEYDHETLLVVIPRSVVEDHATDFTFEDAAAEAGYVEYAA